MLKVLLWIWQLPQCLVGLILSRGYERKSIYYINNRWRSVYYKPFLRSGISLGEFIILDVEFIYKNPYRSVHHEYGHTRQSHRLGWLYLIVVGIPSIIRNAYDRIFHRRWDVKRREQWYYRGFPERWADRLGGVVRKEI